LGDEIVKQEPIRKTVKR